MTRERRGDVADFYAAMVESSDDAIVAMTLDGTVLTWNDAAERHYGFTAAEIVGQSIGAVMPLDRPRELPELLARVSAGERIEHFDTVRRRKDGRLIDMSITTSPIHDQAGHVVGISSIGRDVTERKRLERLIAFRALHDPLTDLPNRILLHDRIDSALMRVRRSGSFVALLFADLDDFKVVNDEHGH
jgi:PAS domain S-box-containing protein